jgi:hypothetical protein
MGTRADFYVGRGKDAEWLGSIAWDGNPEGIAYDKEAGGDKVIAAQIEAEYRAAVENFISKRDDGTKPSDGWPWPWDDSQTTDYSFAFDGGKVYASPFGHGWFVATEDEPDWPENAPKVEFPDMASRKKVTLGKRSGVMVFGIK